MGAQPATEIDAWLRAGGQVVTASERAARALVSAYHRARQAEGLSAWPVPNVADWKSFAHAAWLERTADASLLLNPTQEQALWVEIVARDQSLSTLLDGPRHRLANLAMEAHSLLCSYAPRYLRPTARAGWEQDSAAFSGWLTAFDEVCRTGNLLSPSRLPLQAIPLLESDRADLPPLLLAGFDRILPVQRSLFDAWGKWRQAALGETASEIHFHAAPDAQAELAACARWCARQLTTNPGAQLLVITQEATSRRGEIERAFLQFAAEARTETGASLPFEFSLGVPLSQVAIARAAYLLLRWLSQPLAEHEVDWLFSTGLATATSQESGALTAYMRALRRHGLERMQWTLKAFTGHQLSSSLLPVSRCERIQAAQLQLAEFVTRPQPPLVWAELVPELLEAAGFAQARPLSSAEYQALRRFRQAVEACGSLGFDGRQMSWSDFLIALGHALDGMLFAPESRNAPIQIAGPSESAGLTADAVWFLGVSEDAWPTNGSMHPMLPLDVQREAAMPHATPQLDWDLACSITRRLTTSAPEVRFSYAKQSEASETRPSKHIVQAAGLPVNLPKAQLGPAPLTTAFEDSSRIPFAPGPAEGGASILTAQTQCPFKAFATARLAARGWEPAHPCLTPMQRGNLLHQVLHYIWAGPPDGIRDSAGLARVSDRPAFVATHVERVFATKLPLHLRELLPARYLDLEKQRLIRLISEWLDCEAARETFSVIASEFPRAINVEGLIFHFRLDRLDHLKDQSVLVIDYKTGDVSQKSWDTPRPEDVQLPLYAVEALDRETEPLGGLVFAKLRTGKLEFAGRVGDAASTLLPDLKPSSTLVKSPLTFDQVEAWRDCIHQLARDFLAGRADVNPRDYPKTCERCECACLCRVKEGRALFEDCDESGTVEPADD